MLWAAGMAGVGAFAGPSLVVFGFFGRLTRHRLMVWLTGGALSHI